MVPAEQNSLRYAERISQTLLDKDVKALLVLIGITMGESSPFWAMVNTGVFVRKAEIDRLYILFDDEVSLLSIREEVYNLLRSKRLLAVAERPTLVARPGRNVVGINFPLVPNWRTLIWDS
jgi:hypothetical protein